MKTKSKKKNEPPTVPNLEIKILGINLSARGRYAINAGIFLVSLFMFLIAVGVIQP